MPSRLQVTFCSKVDRENPFESIIHIGGVHLGLSWQQTQPEAIKYIRNGVYSYFVRVAGNEVDVVIAKSRFGNDYIKTEADGENPNNLLTLPPCPSYPSIRL